MEGIFVNQIGYSQNAKKYAYIDCSKIKAKTFSIQNKSGKIIYEGSVCSKKKDRLSETDYSMIQFDELCTPGLYVLKCGDYTSEDFSIGNDLFKDVYISSLRYFYLSRCGEQITDKDFGHSACHTKSALIYGTKDKLKVKGGWHDAGDYGRYVVAGVKTVMDLLLAYECNYYREDFNILDEVSFELKWLLQMQRSDGAVYHKISCYHFCSFIMPQDEKDKIVISPVSTAATADFVGCLAYAVQFYRKQKPAFAQKLLEAAKRAQNYLDLHEDELFINPKEITTGSYGDSHVEDERYFALCSLFGETKNPVYLEKAMRIRNKSSWKEAFFWGNMSAYGTEILLRSQEYIEDSKIVSQLKDVIIERADELLSIMGKSPFNISLDKVHWGSNGQICDEAHILSLAFDLTQNQKYYDAAISNMNYLFGCNPVNKCYISGFGKNTVSKPHHRPSAALKKTMPGMLAGGPCEGLVDAVAKERLTGKAPINCYLDEYESYSTNEIAIYWNSAFVYMLAKLHLV